MNNIHINQLGYRTHDQKKAVIPAECTGFKIMRASCKTEVFSGIAGDPIESRSSLETMRIADFSVLEKTGEFVLCSGEICSPPFIISENPYKELRAAVLEMFNYQKCGVDLNCALWSHPACHTTPAVIYGTNKKKDVCGGWHDAGDYGRYTVPAAKACADLLLAHCLSPNPDSNLLEIAWFEIEWLLKMQDDATGGVYHKVSCYQFNALHEMPHEEQGELVLAPVSSAATANFAAVTALAARLYPEKKDILLKAALKAWDWCSANPDFLFTKTPDIRTGEYGDDMDNDKRFWAACELYISTKDEKFHDYLKKELNSNLVYTKNPWFPSDRRLLSGLGWVNMGTYAVISYLMNVKENADKNILQRMKDELLTDCENYIKRYNNNPYGVSMENIYPWGSNMIIANNAMALIVGSLYVTDDIAKKDEYIKAAYEHFNYLLGKNPLSISYITGFGVNCAKNPHHRPSAAKGKAVPGMVVGGPCSYFDQDPAVNKYCKDAPPSKRYIDDNESFSTNEITIYWNSPVYFVMAVLGM